MWKRLASPVAHVSLATRLTLLGLCASMLGAIALAWYVDTRVTEILLGQAAARAVDQVQFAVQDRVVPADFEPPYTATKLDDLSRRLDPLVARARERDSGLLRVLIYARDGTILYSDVASKRGQVISPSDSEELASTLAGSVSAHLSSLEAVENADLRSRHRGAVEVYVPFVLAGRVVAAYEIYQDEASMRTVHVVLWSVALAGVGALSAAVALGVMVPVWRQRRDQRQSFTAFAGTGAEHPTDLPVGDLLTTGAPSPVAPLPADGPLAAPVAGALAARSPLLHDLTPRELEVLRLMASSGSYRDMAKQLTVSEETVRSHVKNVLRKLGQPDRTQAVLTAVKAGLLEISGLDLTR